MPWSSRGSVLRRNSARRFAASSTSIQSPSTRKRSHQAHIWRKSPSVRGASGSSRGCGSSRSSSSRSRAENRTTRPLLSAAIRMSISRVTSGPSQLLHLVAGDEVPERAAEAGACPVPAVLLGEAIVAVVDLDQAVLIVDRVAERLNGHSIDYRSYIGTAEAVPSSASSALRTDIATQVKIGVSRSV